MNLRWYDRVLVALSGLVLTAAGVGVILAAGGVIHLPAAIAFDTWLGDGWQWMPLVFLAGVLLIFWGLWLVIRPLRRGEGAGKYYMLRNEEHGDVRISVHAIDHLVQKCIRRYGQVVSSRVRIGGREDAMHITLHLTLQSDVNIPRLTSELREDITEQLRQSAGVTVENVQVYVDATKDDKNADEEVKYIEAAARPAPEEEPISTAAFYTAPVVVTGESLSHEPQVRPEPTISELKKQIDLGPDEPLPVDLSDDAFPFPEREAGVPLEIYTEDLPPTQDTKEDATDE